MTGTWENVPWVVGGGVKHQASVARLLAYAGFNGRQGIVGTPDLEVVPLDVPGASVRVMPGACGVLNREPEYDYEMYAARIPNEPDVVAIAATGSGSGRCDLIVAEVMNPFVDDDYDEPSAESIADGSASFVRTGILTLPVGTRHPTASEIAATIGTKSALPLASILLPASTGTVTAPMIRSQRTMAGVRSSYEMRVVNPVEEIVLNNVDYKNIASQVIVVPEWATHLSARAILAGARFNNPGTKGGTRIAIESSAGTVYGEGVAFDSQSTNPDRIGLMAVARNIVMPKAIRGGTITVRMQGARTATFQNLVIDQYTAVSIDAAFVALPESNFPLLSFA